MEHRQKEKMQWILFVVFLALFVVLTIVTIYILLTGAGTLTKLERGVLFTSFILEVSCAIIALFYYIFGMTRSGTKQHESNPNAHDEEVPKEEFHPFCNSTLYSIIYNPKHVDEIHIFSYVFRQDMIDYHNKEYHSIRQLIGKNNSKKDSLFVWCSEATKIPTKFSGFIIKAKELSTGDELAIEYDGDIEADNIVHPFKILFPKPLQPGQEFRIAYYIFIPEKNDMIGRKDSMSMSLSRMRKIEKLDFNVCLNFKPKNYKAEVLSFDKVKHNLNESECTLSKYTPSTDFEKEYDLEWSSQPYVIKCHLTSHPLLLAVNYQC